MNVDPCLGVLSDLESLLFPLLGGIEKVSNVLLVDLIKAHSESELLLQRVVFHLVEERLDDPRYDP